MACRGHLDVPVIGVARSPWTLAQLQARARKSIQERHPNIDEEAFCKLTDQLRYVAGDYADPATCLQVHQQLRGARHPLYYLAVPPSVFPAVIAGLASSGCADQAKTCLPQYMRRWLCSSPVSQIVVIAAFHDRSWVSAARN